MPGPILLLLLVGASSAIYCDYNEGIIDDYLADEENLYCFDGGLIEIDENSRLCSNEYGFLTARADDMTVLCPDTHTLVGYTNYECDEDGVLAATLINDAVLTPYSNCNNDTTNLCLDVSTASASTKLLFTGDVTNVDLQTSDDVSIVYYAMGCDDGYDFHDDVSGTVYGYCSGNSDGNTLSFKEDATADGCYDKCPADPTADDVTSEITNVVSVDITEAQRSGASVDASVVCDTGFELASDAATTYEFTCDGSMANENTTGNSGSYSCSDCPVCLATCPANPTSTNLAEMFDNVDSLVVEESASGLTVAVEIVCSEGFALASDAATTYDFQCSSDVDTAASNGTYTLVGASPVCLPQCDEDQAVSIDYVTLVKVDVGVFGEVKEAEIICDAGHSLPYGHSGNWDFECGAGDGTALSGVFECADDDGCPVCEEYCEIPEDTDELTFSMADGTPFTDHSEGIPPGLDIIEATCVNSSLNLVGKRFFACSGGSVNVTGDDAPYCADTPICEAPIVHNADRSSSDNLEIGSVYSITCHSSYWFDVTTAQTYGDLDDDTSYYQAEVTCEGEELPEFHCYFGCMPPDFAGGVTYPDISTDGEAPYAMGAAVTFECLDGSVIEPEAAEATCEPGGIPSPVCSACSISIAFSLIFSLLRSLLA